jgi:hypothetical protein
MIWSTPIGSWRPPRSMRPVTWFSGGMLVQSIRWRLFTQLHPALGEIARPVRPDRHLLLVVDEAHLYRGAVILVDEIVISRNLPRASQYVIGERFPPAVLAQLAVRYLRLPDPVIRSSPAPNAVQLTRLPTWLWVAPATWQPQSRTAHVPGESVTATATPVSASWRMGDGKTVTCHGPGTAYTSGDNPASPSPTCGYTYTRSSAGQPHAAYHVTVTITWDITWTGPGGAGGALPPLFTAAAAAMRVAESQAVNTAGGA